MSSPTSIAPPPSPAPPIPSANPATPPPPNLDAEQAILNVQMSEFQQLREELRQFNNARHNLINYLAAAVIAAPPILLGLNLANDVLAVLLLVLPIVFFPLLITSLGYSRLVNVIAYYTYERLGSQIRQTAKRIDANAPNLLGWHEYYDRHQKLNNAMAGIGEISTLAIPFLMSLGVFIYLIASNAIEWNPGYVIGFVFDVGLAVIVLWLAVKSARDLD